MTLRYNEKTIAIQGDSGESIELTIGAAGAQEYAVLKLIRCVVDIDENEKTGRIEDEILSIRHTPDIYAVYQLRDFLSWALSEKKAFCDQSTQ